MNAALISPTARVASLSSPPPSSSSSSSFSSSSRQFHKIGFLLPRAKRGGNCRIRSNNSIRIYAADIDNFVKPSPRLKHKYRSRFVGGWQIERGYQLDALDSKVEYDDKDRTKTKWILETEQFGQKLQFYWTAKTWNQWNTNEWLGSPRTV